MFPPMLRDAAVGGYKGTTPPQTPPTPQGMLLSGLQRYYFCPDTLYTPEKPVKRHRLGSVSPYRLRWYVSAGVQHTLHVSAGVQHTLHVEMVCFSWCPTHPTCRYGMFHLVSNTPYMFQLVSNTPYMWRWYVSAGVQHTLHVDMVCFSWCPTRLT